MAINEQANHLEANGCLKGKKYLTLTWGCQMNERDSEIIGGMLEEIGMVPESSPHRADVVVLNTCCVREKAELKVYGKIGELVRLKRDHPEMVIVVCGCMVQQKDVPEQIIQRFPLNDSADSVRSARVIRCAFLASMPELDAR